MKITHLTTAILLALTLSACSSDDENTSTQPPVNPEEPTVPDPEPETPEQPVPVPEVYLDENFDQMTEIPATWSMPRSNAGTVYLSEGSLFLDGRANDTQMTSVMLPQEYQKLRNYRIDMEFAYVERNNGGRWGSIIYRAADHYAEPAFSPYYQFAIRGDATGASGLELALRQPTNAWNVLHKSAYKENIDPTKTYKATVIVHGKRVRHYINDELVLDTSLPYSLDQGGIGLSTAGLLMRVESLKITEQLDALPESNKVTDIIDHRLPVSMAPTLAQPAPLTGNASVNATHIAYQLDEQLNLLNANNQKVMHLRDYLNDSNRRTLPLLTVKNENTITQLKALSTNYDLTDFTFVSDQADLLRKVRLALPSSRTALDYSRHTGLTHSRKDIVQIAHNTNSSLSKIVILPSHLVKQEVVSHLQRLLITPWASTNTTTPVSAAQILTTGVNGILTTQPDTFQNLMKSMAPNTLLRKPLITGHRGIPALDDENTLESMLKAIEVGADAVEYDVYITKDGHVVLMHDDTTTRTTGVARKIEEMTLAEVRELRTLGKQRQIPTMDEVLTEVKKYPHVVNFIEIKSPKPEIVPAIKALLDQHDAYDQSIVISFSGAQILHMKNVLPGVSTGFLTNTPTAQSDIVNTRRILDATQQYSSTFNPSFGGLSKELMTLASQRGVTFWPWTFRLNKEDFNRMYVQGTHGLTTDYAHDSSNLIVKLKTPAEITATVGKPVEISGQTTTQVGEKTTYIFKEMLVLPQSAKYTQAGQAVTFSEKGTAYVMPRYNYTMAPNYSYTLYAAPVKVTIQ